MKKKTALFIGLTYIAIICAANNPTSLASTPDSWAQKASIPYPHGIYQFAAASFNGHNYVATPPNDLWVYDTGADTWTKQGQIPLPTGLSLSSTYGLSVCENKLYVMGAVTNSTMFLTYVNQAYDFATNTWQNKTAIEFGYDCKADIVNGKIYMLYDNAVYDPANDSWSQIAANPAAPTDGRHVFEEYASAVLDGKIYVMGGFWRTGWSDYTFLDSVEIYDPATNLWTQGAPMPKAMSGMAAGTTGTYAAERIYVMGGIDANFTVYNSTQVYDPQSGNWSTATPMPISTNDLNLVNVNDQLYALGRTANYQYTPANWTEPAPTPTPTSTPSPTQTPTLSPAPTLTPSASVPEFPAWTALLLILVIISVAVAVTAKRDRLRKPSFS